MARSQEKAKEKETHVKLFQCLKTELLCFSSLTVEKYSNGASNHKARRKSHDLTA